MNLRFEDYFSDEKIINALIKVRISKARERHNLQFYKNINSEAKNPNSITDSVDTLFPPRNRWYRPTLKERWNKSSFEINAFALRKTVFSKIKNIAYPEECWIKELVSFMNDVRKAALQNPGYKISEPRITPIKKERKGNTYRAIAVYRLHDSILIGLTGQYLRDVTDRLFLKCAYAFRAKSENTPTHHTAVADLIGYLEKYEGKPLYVAECDIKKFFDTVHHQKAIDSLFEIDKRLNDSGGYIDSRAIGIFKSFLNSYSFEKTALKKGQQWLDAKGIKGEILWIKEDLEKIYGNLSEEPVGVPQGGAISTIIANLLLDKADQAVCQDSEIFYARYCDDMIIIHPDKNKCEEAFKRYISALTDCNLVIHKPISITRYDKTFYDHKSKNPYMWSKPDVSVKDIGVSPWISFLGYQIRYDKKIRIRRASIEKELEKQNKIARKVLKMIELNNTVSDKSRGQIVHRLRSKLLYMSVGRVLINKPSALNNQYCWASGFKLLAQHDCDLSQLKCLDRNREKRISQVKKELKNHKIQKTEQPKYKNKLKYYGAPFSYYAQFRKSKRL